MFPLRINSNYFEVVTSFKPFNSTGAISFSSNDFNGVSFEWALTHRSFPRILPDSSNSFRSYSQIHCKVWRKNELSSVKCLSPRSFKLFLLLAQPLCFSFSWSISTIHGGVSHRHSQHLKTEEVFPLNLAPFSSRFMVLAWCHPLIIVFDCENSFHPSDAFQGLLSFLDHPKAIISKDFFIILFQLHFRN